MKLNGLKISVGLLAGLALFLGFSIVTLKAENGEQEKGLKYCSYYGIDLDKESIYADWDKSAEDIITLYHKTINEKFNYYIKKMVTSKPSDENYAKNSKPPETDDQGLPILDEKTGLSKDCAGENFSTYCVAETLLKSKQFGYMAYRQAMNCRKMELLDSKKAVEDYRKYSDVMIWGKKNENNAAQNYANQQALENTYGTGFFYGLTTIGSEDVDKEIDAAKRALDQTLSAYSQLKGAWAMHKKYVDIYKSLVKFRDKMADIRHQIDGYPAKFIDATTTKCT